MKFSNSKLDARIKSQKLTNADVVKKMKASGRKTSPAQVQKWRSGRRTPTLLNAVVLGRVLKLRSIEEMFVIK